MLLNTDERPVDTEEKFVGVGVRYSETPSIVRDSDIVDRKLIGGPKSAHEVSSGKLKLDNTQEEVLVDVIRKQNPNPYAVFIESFSYFLLNPFVEGIMAKNQAVYDKNGVVVGSVSYTFPGFSTYFNERKLGKKADEVAKTFVDAGFGIANVLEWFVGDDDFHTRNVAISEDAAGVKRIAVFDTDRWFGWKTHDKGRYGISRRFGNSCSRRACALTCEDVDNVLSVASSGAFYNPLGESHLFTTAKNRFNSDDRQAFRKAISKNDKYQYDVYYTLLKLAYFLSDEFIEKVANETIPDINLKAMLDDARVSADQKIVLRNIKIGKNSDLRETMIKAVKKRREEFRKAIIGSKEFKEWFRVNKEQITSDLRGDSERGDHELVNALSGLDVEDKIGEVGRDLEKKTIDDSVDKISKCKNAKEVQQMVFSAEDISIGNRFKLLLAALRQDKEFSYSKDLVILFWERYFSSFKDSEQLQQLRGPVFSIVNEMLFSPENKDMNLVTKEVMKFFKVLREKGQFPKNSFDYFRDILLINAAKGKGKRKATPNEFSRDFFAEILRMMEGDYLLQKDNLIGVDAPTNFDFAMLSMLCDLVSQFEAEDVGLFFEELKKCKFDDDVLEEIKEAVNIASIYVYDCLGAKFVTRNDGDQEREKALLYDYELLELIRRGRNDDVANYLIDKCDWKRISVFLGNLEYCYDVSLEDKNQFYSMLHNVIRNKFFELIVKGKNDEAADVIIKKCDKDSILALLNELALNYSGKKDGFYDVLKTKLDHTQLEVAKGFDDDLRKIANNRSEPIAYYLVPDRLDTSEKKFTDYLARLDISEKDETFIALRLFNNEIALTYEQDNKVQKIIDCLYSLNKECLAGRQNFDDIKEEDRDKLLFFIQSLNIIDLESKAFFERTKYTFNCDIRMVNQLKDRYISEFNSREIHSDVRVVEDDITKDEYFVSKIARFGDCNTVINDLFLNRSKSAALLFIKNVYDNKYQISQEARDYFIKTVKGNNTLRPFVEELENPSFSTRQSRITEIASKIILLGLFSIAKLFGIKMVMDYTSRELMKIYSWKFLPRPNNPSIRNKRESAGLNKKNDQKVEVNPSRVAEELEARKEPPSIRVP